MPWEEIRFPRDSGVSEAIKTARLRKHMCENERLGWFAPNSEGNDKVEYRAGKHMEYAVSTRKTDDIKGSTKYSRHSTNDFFSKPGLGAMNMMKEKLRQR